MKGVKIVSTPRCHEGPAMPKRCRHCRRRITFLTSDHGIPIGWVHESTMSYYCDLSGTVKAVPA